VAQRVHRAPCAMEAKDPDLIRTDEAMMRERLRDLIRERPLLVMSAAAGIGAALGGIVFSRLGRLAFFAVAGYVANELWHREGRLDIDDVIAKLSPR
jgi:hypothetical protein